MDNAKRSIGRNIRLACIALILITLAVNALGLMAYNDSIQNYARHSFETLAANMAAQVNMAMDSLEETAKSVIYAVQLQQVLFSNVPTDYLRAASGADQIIELVADANVYADHIYMLAQNGRHAYVLSSARDLCRPILKEMMVQGALPTATVYTTTVLKETGLLPRPYLLCILPIMDIRPGQFSIQPKGLGAVACDLNSMLDSLQGATDSGSTIALIDGNEILASARPLSAEEEALILGQEEGNNTRFFVHHIKPAHLPWSFAFLTPRETLEGNAPTLRNISFALLALELLALVLLFTQLIASVTRPLNRLVSDVGAIQHADYTRVRASDTAEFATLSGAINQMLEDIEIAGENERAARERLFEAQEEQTRAKLYAYRSQVNPHFLFNALECIRSLAQQHHVDDIETQVQSLSRSYRYLLDADMVVTLGDELRHAASYFNVLKPQSQPPPVLRIHAQQDTLRTAMLSLTLQPLIENALIHGIADSPRPGMLHIWARTDPAQPGVLLVSVTDNGVGMDAETIAHLSQAMQDDAALADGRHIGLRNVARRLRLFFGDDFGLILTSSKGHYTSVTLRIPQKTIKEEAQ